MQFSGTPARIISRVLLFIALLAMPLAAYFGTPGSRAQNDDGHAPLAMCSTPNFAAAVPFPVGAMPQGLEAGDFNGDGKKDLAVANFSGNTVSILLGNGTGGFTLNATLNAGTNPSAVAVSDFNNDGKSDLAVTNSGSDDVSIFLGNGSGGFGNAVNFSVGANPSSLGVGDFNNDNRRDLAVANADTDDFSILNGNGNGGFAPPRSFPAELSPLALAVGDYNGDGRSDVAIVNFVSENVSVHINLGNGMFIRGSELFTGTAPSDIAGGDFNGDGRNDLAVVNTGSFDVSVFLHNNGPGPGGAGFANPVLYDVGANPSSIATADFNGDGRLDLAVANADSKDISVLLGNANGTFQTAVNFPIINSSSAIVAADFTNDSNIDMATANADVNNISTVRNTCGAVTPTPTPTPGPMLITETGSDRALALASVSLRRDPFPLNDAYNLSPDQRARVILFASNIPSGATVTAQAADAQNNLYPLVVESVNPVPEQALFRQIVVRLPAQLGADGNVRVTLSVNGVASNPARVYFIP